MSNAYAENIQHFIFQDTYQLVNDKTINRFKTVNQVLQKGTFSRLDFP